MIINQKGSCVLILVLISATIFLYYLNAEKSAAFMSDALHKKYHYEKQFRLTESLYLYGLTIVINNIENLFQQVRENEKLQNQTIYNGIWPIATTHCRGVLTLFIKEPKIIIQSTVIEKNQENFQIKAVITREEIVNPLNKKSTLKKIEISEWQINES